MKFKDRVKEFRRVKASDLKRNPLNWRTHPKNQSDAMKGLLAEVGFAGACIARETPDGLELIDGHLRSDVSGDTEIPVLILDVNEDEAKKLLATFDPISAMAGADGENLDAILKDVKFENDELNNLIDGLAEESGINVELMELPDISETIRHTVVVAYHDEDIPKMCRWLNVDALPVRLGVAILDRIKQD